VIVGDLFYLDGEITSLYFHLNNKNLVVLKKLKTHIYVILAYIYHIAMYINTPYSLKKYIIANATNWTALPLLVNQAFSLYKILTALNIPLVLGIALSCHYW
jgi:hypothetical protein